MPGENVITSSLYLNPDTWDIELDDTGNIAVVENPYACAQDVATACSAFRGECIYDVNIGVPYYPAIIGKNPGSGVVQSALETEALRLPYIATADATVVTNRAERVCGGVIVVTDTNGLSRTVNL